MSNTLEETQTRVRWSWSRREGYDRYDLYCVKDYYRDGSHIKSMYLDSDGQWNLRNEGELIDSAFTVSGQMIDALRSTQFDWKKGEELLTDIFTKMIIAIGELNEGS